MDTDPRKSLEFARQAESLGDPCSLQLQSELLDYKGAHHSGQMGKTRVQTISQLISKLDPVFAFNCTKSTEIRKTGFVKYLTSRAINIDFLQKNFSFNFIPDQWHACSIESMKKILVDSPGSFCIICLKNVQSSFPCPNCQFKVT